MRLEELVNLEGKDSTYISAITRRFNEYMKFSELPVIYKQNDIDINNCSSRIITLYDNIEMIINDRLSFLFNVKDYANTGYISAMLLNKYFKSSIESDSLISSVLYVDTNLLLDDFKKSIDNNQENVDISLTYSEDTIRKNIENAHFVIWDRFSMINSSYERQRIYNILLIRHRKNLANIFFMKNAPKELERICDDEMFQILDCDNIIDLKDEQISFKQYKNNEGSIQW